MYMYKIVLTLPICLERANIGPSMFINEYFIVFPEGDTQEIPSRLSLNDIVDINGQPIPLPLPTNRMIAFRVAKIRVNENRGGNETFHHLELLSAEELLPYARPQGAQAQGTYGRFGI
jgi:hypothetical protein